MKILFSILRLTISILCIGLISACSKGGGGKSPTSDYVAHYLVSDGALAADYVDTNLIDPWGIIFAPNSPVLVINKGTQTGTMYDGNGVKQSTTITFPSGANGAANPTGGVYNGTSDFVVSKNGVSAPANYVFDGEGGTITAWSNSVSSNPMIVYDDGTGGAVYKGLAIASVGNQNYVYASDFHNSKVDVFNGSFMKVTTHGNFTDPNIPSGYAPFGIQNIGGNIIVTFAQQTAPDNRLNNTGAGLGYVDMFDVSGNLIKRIATQGPLNAPWGVVMAPSNFAGFSNMLLIGNFGDGRINAYDINMGNFMGTLADKNGTPVQVPGMWGLAFGNGAASQPTNTLYFASGINKGNDGVYGRIPAQSSSTSSGGSGSGGGY